MCWFVDQWIIRCVGIQVSRTVMYECASRSSLLCTTVRKFCMAKNGSVLQEWRSTRKGNQVPTSRCRGMRQARFFAPCLVSLALRQIFAFPFGNVALLTAAALIYFTPFFEALFATKSVAIDEVFGLFSQDGRCRVMVGW